MVDILVSDFKQTLAALDPTSSEAEKDLLKLFTVWKKLKEAKENDVELIRGSTLILTLANVLKEKEDMWSKDWPEWIDKIAEYLRERGGVPNIFPTDQLRLLLDVLRKYIISGAWDALFSFSCIACFDAAREILLEDQELQNVMRKALDKKHTLLYFCSVAGPSDKWQLKLMQDQELISNILALPESEFVWRVFTILARHPDAKELLPKEVLSKANASDFALCTNISAILSNENDRGTKVNEQWMENMSTLLRELLAIGLAKHEGQVYGLMDLILPIANLSVVDALKVVLGKLVIEPVLRVVINEKLPKAPLVQRFLPRGRQEASRALWNFAYEEANRTIISNLDGISKLTQALAQTEDPILKKNIEGVLHMYSPPKPADQPTGAKGHVMLSYNWGSKPTVLKIAEELKKRGYNVWLDVEQMAGSTLEAMASAIEHADLVLMCMSQKYKDSPNCRLEGEYTVNRKKPFVPVMLQQQYSPDGWLGIALGAKLYHDFSVDNDWESKVQGLIKEIGNAGKVGAPVSQGPTLQAPNAPKVKTVSDWTLEDVHNWTKTENIEQHFPRLREQQFDGKALYELKHLIPPQKSTYFFENICETLQIGSIGEKLRFVAAIRKL